MRVALFAADDFAIPVCRLLSGANLLACLVTQPDKPRGRGRKASPLPIRIEAEKAGVATFIPETLNDADFKMKFSSLGVDIPVIAAYGLFVPRWIRDWHPFPCVNIHPSLLPRWRGADPIRQAIVAGDKVTGITIHFTEKKMDSGDIITVSDEIAIDGNQTFFELRDLLADRSSALLMDFISRISKLEITASENPGIHSGKEAIRQTFRCIPQDESRATTTSKLEKSETWINWSRSANEIHNQVRGLSPEPSARTGKPENPIKILRTELITQDISNRSSMPGEVISSTGDNFLIKCGTGAIRILELQPSGKRVMSATDFINGYRLKPGDNFSGI